MLNIRKFIFVTIFILLSFAIVGCDRVGVDLPEEDADEIMEILRGEEFTNFVVWDSNTRKSVKFKRTAKEDGKPLYTTRRISGPISVENIEDVTPYSVVGCVLSGNDHSCNLIKIDGQEQVLLCKSDEEARSLSSEAIVNDTIETKDIQSKPYKTTFYPMSERLVKNLEELAGSTIKELGFATVVVGKGENRRVVLLHSEFYEKRPNVALLLGSISEIKENIIGATVVTYKTNPCCVTDVRNGAAVETCRKKCF